MSQDNNYSQGPVPLAARKGVVPLTFVMLGLTFFSASMWTGGTLGTGLSYNDFFLAVLFGNLLLGIYTAFLGYIGAKTGLSTHLLARYSFGIKGSWLPSMLLGGTQVGWFGVGVAMFAIPVSKATGIDVNILIAVSGLLMTMTIFFGISALTILSIIAVPAIVILGSYSVWLAVDGVGGLDHLKAIVPQTPLSFSGALALVVGSFISAGTLTADFVRFGRNAKGAVVVAMVAFFPWQLADVYLRCGRRRGSWTGGYLGRDDRSGATAARHYRSRSEHLDNQRQRALCVGSGLCQRDRPFQPHAVGG